MAAVAVVPNPKARASRASIVDVTAKRLKPSTVDELAKQFLNTKVRMQLVDAELDLVKERLLMLVDTYGRVPAKASKSKRISGIIYDATATYGTSTNVDTESAERLLALINAGMERPAAQRLFDSLFVFAPKYSLAPNALKVIAGKLPKGSPRNVRHLFDQAVKISPNSPTLKVGEREKASK